MAASTVNYTIDEILKRIDDSCPICKQYDIPSWIVHMQNLIPLYNKYKFIPTSRPVSYDDLAKINENFNVWIKNYNITWYEIYDKLQKIKHVASELSDEWDAIPQNIQKTIWEQTQLPPHYFYLPKGLVKACLFAATASNDHKCPTKHDDKYLPADEILPASALFITICHLNLSSKIPDYEKAKYRTYTTQDIILSYMSLLNSKLKRLHTVLDQCNRVLTALMVQITGYVRSPIPYNEAFEPIKIDYNLIPHQITLEKKK